MLSGQDVGYGVLALAGYQLVRVSAQRLVRYLNPVFYAQLQGDPSRKLRPYFVFPLGILLTLVSAPICMEAFVSTPASTDGFRATRGLSRAEKICVGSRGVLWISELPMLSFSSEYVAHHVLSLWSLTMVLLANFPRRPLYLIYAGLITELFSDSFSILRHHECTIQNSKAVRSFMLINALSLLVLRVGPAFFFSVGTLMPVTSVHQTAYIASIMFYCGYLVLLAYKQLSALNYLRLVLDRPAHIRVMEKYDIQLYRVLLGAAMVAAQVSTAIVFINAHGSPLTDAEIQSLAKTGLGSAVVGLLGARLLNPLLDSTPRTTPSEDKPPHRRLTIDSSLSPSTPVDPMCAVGAGFLEGSTYAAVAGCPAGATYRTTGISIQGGLLSATLFVLLPNTMAPSLEKSMLLQSMALSVPLGEGIGRIGCYLAGCCGSRLQQGKEQYNATQLLSSTANISAFVILIWSLRTAGVSLREAGVLAILSNAAIRLAVDPLRSSAITDGKKVATTTLFALSQLLLSAGILAGVNRALGLGITSAIGAAAFMTGLTVLAAHVARWVWLTLAQMASLRRTKMATFMRPMTAVAGFAIVIFSLVIKDKLGCSSWYASEVTLSSDDNLSELLSSSAFLGNIIVTGSMPLLLSSLTDRVVSCPYSVGAYNGKTKFNK